jgi:hypothetical protein
VRPQHEHAISASRAAADDYTPHRLEETVLYYAPCSTLEDVCRPIGSRAEPPVLPAFVVAEVGAFLRCGILSHGPIVAKCRDCGWCRSVAFSCRHRSFGPTGPRRGRRIIRVRGAPADLDPRPRRRAETGIGNILPECDLTLTSQRQNVCPLVNVCLTSTIAFQYKDYRILRIQRIERR